MTRKRIKKRNKKQNNLRNQGINQSVVVNVTERKEKKEGKTRRRRRKAGARKAGAKKAMPIPVVPPMQTFTQLGPPPQLIDTVGIANRMADSMARQGLVQTATIQDVTPRQGLIGGPAPGPTLDEIRQLIEGAPKSDPVDAFKNALMARKTPKAIEFAQMLGTIDAQIAPQRSGIAKGKQPARRAKTSLTDIDDSEATESVSSNRPTRFSTRNDRFEDLLDSTIKKGKTPPAIPSDTDAPFRAPYSDQAFMSPDTDLSGATRANVEKEKRSIREYMRSTGKEISSARKRQSAVVVPMDAEPGPGPLIGSEAEQSLGDIAGPATAVNWTAPLARLKTPLVAGQVASIIMQNGDKAAINRIKHLGGGALSVADVIRLRTSIQVMDESVKMDSSKRRLKTANVLESIFKKMNRKAQQPKKPTPPRVMRPRPKPKK
jgi:hypothetical protein